MSERVYTSYFANLKNLAESGVVPISISLRSPKWYKGLEYGGLAPLGAWLSLREKEYTELFNDRLNKFNPIAEFDMLKRIAGGKSFALLCYEKPGDFCHRNLVADWFNRKLPENILSPKIIEFPIYPKVKEKIVAPIQISLF